MPNTSDKPIISDDAFTNLPPGIFFHTATDTDTTIILAMLHDIGHYLVEDGFDPFMEWIGRAHPDLIRIAALTGHDYREACRRNLDRFLHEIHHHCEIDSNADDSGDDASVE